MDTREEMKAKLLALREREAQTKVVGVFGAFQILDFKYADKLCVTDADGKTITFTADDGQRDAAYYNRLLRSFLV